MPSRPALTPNPHPKPNFNSVFLILVTFTASLIILLAIFYFLYYLWYSAVHRSRTIPYDSGNPLVKLQRFTYRELKSATQGFGEENVIGKGGSGTVFRGILKDGKLVAVKLLDCTSLQAEREFQNEIQVLGGLKSPFIVSLLGFCVQKRKKFVVYEYMPNRSLQESLFLESSLGLNWARRYDIILDVARALAFLHLECDPPVIHGDVKPSNVLLDSEYRAKLSDFGLSRLKLEGEFGVDLFSQELGKNNYQWKSQDLSGNLGAVGCESTETPVLGTPVESADEVDFALALQASSSSKNSRVLCDVRSFNISNPFSYNGDFDYENEVGMPKNAKGKRVLAVENGGEDLNKFFSYDDMGELCSADHSKELSPNVALGEDGGEARAERQWGKDWWWKQEGSGELCSKDYVMEWIGSQISPTATPDWDEEKKSSVERVNWDGSARLDKFEEVNEMQQQDSSIGCPVQTVERAEPKRWRSPPCKKQKKMQEWWREEHIGELSRKGSNKQKVLGIKWRKGIKVPRFDWRRHFRFRSELVSKHQSQDEGGSNVEFSFRKGLKKKNARSLESEMWSGDLFSRELSSTTSMRGTLCYVAPEYGGCGLLMEKTDIYSLGVLILVILSGRRPLHILSSPMKLEKANLISWCRHLAHSGNVLDIIDEKLKQSYNKEQANLCINLALACLQKMPELRPNIGDIVKILRGDMDLPSLQFEFSPSPPSKLFSRSRRKPKNTAE